MGRPDLANGEASRLERAALAPKTARDYARRLSKFEEFCQQSKLVLTSVATTELAALEFFDHLFLEGRGAGEGVKLLSALRQSMGAPGRSLAEQWPRASLALAGWRKLKINHTRLPLPIPVVEALAMTLASVGRANSALAILVGTDGYLRPCELLDIRHHDVFLGLGDPAMSLHGIDKPSILLRPERRGVPTKTNVFSDSVVMDGKIWPWLKDVLRKEIDQGRGEAQVFPVSQKVLNADISRGMKLLGLEGWGATGHILRHSGPAGDILAQRRTISEVQKRGRWACTESVRRYERSGQVGARMQLLASSQLAYIKECHETLGAVRMNQRRPIAPPPGLSRFNTRDLKQSRSSRGRAGLRGL